MQLISSLLNVQGRPEKMYLNECLTYETRQLHKAALSLKEEKAYSYVWTRNGTVYIRKKDGDILVPIKPKLKMSKETSVSRDEQIFKAKELYSQGSRNFLVKCFSEAADELSQVCSIYEEIYGVLSDELGMPYLLYAKSLIALALEENKVIDVVDEEMENDDAKEDGRCSSELAEDVKHATPEFKEDEHNLIKGAIREETNKLTESKEDSSHTTQESIKFEADKDKFATCPENKLTVPDSESPSTSIATKEDALDEESEESGLQLAWEILEIAAKIFIRQGEKGLPNLAEVYVELANIEFENNILDCARDDYEKALKIYEILQCRRAMAEIHYKIGLTYVMQQMNKEGAESLKKACALIEDEIMQLSSQAVLTEKESEDLKNVNEIRQDICAKIFEVEEARQQQISEVRAALDNFMGTSRESSANVQALSSTATKTASPKPSDISYLIKRKKSNTPPNSSSEASELSAKRQVS